VPVLAAAVAATSRVIWMMTSHFDPRPYFVS
jgi:hypothetical protein